MKFLINNFVDTTQFDTCDSLNCNQKAQRWFLHTTAFRKTHLICRCAQHGVYTLTWPRDEHGSEMREISEAEVITFCVMNS